MTKLEALWEAAETARDLVGWSRTDNKINRERPPSKEERDASRAAMRWDHLVGIERQALRHRLQAAEALLDAVLDFDESGVPQSKAHSADLALGVHWNDPDAALAAADAWNKARGWEPAGSDWLVTVCESCRRASCWQGDSMCEEARGANVVQVMRSQLLIERREHSDFWQHDRPTGNQPT